MSIELIALTAQSDLNAAWTGDANILVRNGSFATCSTADDATAVTDLTGATPVPSTAVIRRVRIHGFGSGSDSSSAHRTIKIALTTDGTTEMAGADTENVVLGESTNHGFLASADEGRWGVILTAANINSATFGVLVSKTTATGSVSIDYVEVEIEYTESNQYAGIGPGRIFVAQFANIAFIANGSSPLLKDHGGGTEYFHIAGTKAPGSAPTLNNTGGSGDVTGVKRAYVTFLNVLDSSRSNPSAASIAFTFDDGIAAITNIPTHRDLVEMEEANAHREVWLTLAGSPEAFLVSTLENNTTTSLNVSITDGALSVLENLDLVNNGPPPAHRYLAMDKERLVMAGEKVMVATATMTFNSTLVNVTWDSGTHPLEMFQDIHVGKWIIVDGEQGRYSVASIDSNSALTLDQAYQGDTGSKTIRLFSRLATSVAWSQAGFPQSFRARSSKTFAVQDSDEITGLYSYFGRHLITMRRNIGFFSWTIDPEEDGKLELAVQGRGALEACFVMAEGVGYGMDSIGIYRYEGGRRVENIDGPVRPIIDGRPGEPVQVDWTKTGRFWALPDERFGLVHFFVVMQDSVSGYPEHSLTYDYLNNVWMVCKWEQPITCGGYVVLTSGRFEPLVAMGETSSYPWAFWSGAADGVTASMVYSGTCTTQGPPDANLRHQTKPAALSSYAEGVDPTTWSDTSGQSNHALSTNPQSTISVRKAGVNGLDYVEIAGDDAIPDDHFKLTSELGAPGIRSVLQVMRFPTTIQNGNWNHNCETFLDFDSLETQEHYINVNPISGERIDLECGYTGTGDDLLTAEASVQASLVGEWGIVLATHGNTTMSQYLNSATAGATDTVVGFVEEDVEDGEVPRLGFTARMDLAQTEVWDIDLSAAEREEVLYQAGQDFGITVDLTSAGVTTLADSAASFPTSNNGLAGSTVTKTDSSSGTETRVIVSNTATVLTVAAAWDDAPRVGDTYKIGRIESYWTSGWHDFNAPGFKKRVSEVRAQLRKGDTEKAKLRLFTDWETSGETIVRDLDDLGVDATQGNSYYELDPDDEKGLGQAYIGIGDIRAYLLSVRIEYDSAGTRPVLDKLTVYGTVDQSETRS